MPNEALMQFLEDVKKPDAALQKVTLKLENAKDIASFLEALGNPANPGSTTITELNLSGTQFTAHELTKVPDLMKLTQILKALPAIKTLILDSCKIDDKQAVYLAWPMAITHLSLKMNALERPMFNPNLEFLYLDNNKALKGRYASKVPQKTRKLSLLGCKQNDAFLESLPQQPLQDLVHLNLRDNQVTNYSLGKLSSLPSLTELDLSQNPDIKNEGVKKVAELTNGKTPALAHLDILRMDCCTIDSQALPHIAAIKVRELDLSHNLGLKPSWDTKISWKPRDLKKTANKTVKSLIIDSCGLEDGHVAKLSLLFPALTSLHAVENHFTLDGITALLIQNKKLTCLNVLPQKAVSNAQRISPRTEESKKTAAEKALCDAIIAATDLEQINIPELPDALLLQIIPQEGDGRKLKSINGRSCEDLRKALEPASASQSTEAIPKVAALEVVGTFSKSSARRRTSRKQEPDSQGTESATPNTDALSAVGTFSKSSTRRKSARKQRHSLVVPTEATASRNEDTPTTSDENTTQPTSLPN